MNCSASRACEAGAFVSRKSWTPSTRIAMPRRSGFASAPIVPAAFEKLTVAG
jgi:hypothetical protein